MTSLFLKCCGLPAWRSAHALPLLLLLSHLGVVVSQNCPEAHFDERVEGWITSSYCVDCGTTVSVQLVQRITWNSSVLTYLHISASFLLIEILTYTLSVSQSIWGLKSVIYWQIARLFAFPPFIVRDKHIGSAHCSCVLRLACTDIRGGKINLLLLFCIWVFGIWCQH